MHGSRTLGHLCKPFGVHAHTQEHKKQTACIDLKACSADAWFLYVGEQTQVISIFKVVSRRQEIHLMSA
jgi:hypothetical protein